MEKQFEAFLRSIMMAPPIEDKNPGGWNVDSWVSQSARLFAGNLAYGADSNYRADTATGLFENQLQHLMAQSYDRKYPGLLARTMVPMASGIPVGAETVVQRGYDITGGSTLISGEATDVRRVSLSGTESTTRIVALAVKWSITQQQLMAAAMSGVDLDGKQANAAMRIIERDIDELISLGSLGGTSNLGLIGFLSQATKAPGAAGAGVELYATGAPAAFVADWNGVATAAEILNDFSILMAKFRAANIWVPDRCRLGSSTFSRLETLQAFAGTEKTVLDVLRSRYSGISFEPWWRCDTAGAASVERAVLYSASNEIAEAIVSMEPVNLPPVWSGLGYETITYARCGGIQASDTTGIVYIDM